MKTITTVLIIALAAALTACGSSTQCPATADDVEPGATVTTGEFTVRLLEAGDEPLQEMRYQVAEDTAELLSIEIVTASAASVANRASPLRIGAPVTMNVAAGPVALSEEGDMEYNVIIDNIVANPLPGTDVSGVGILASTLEPISQIEGTVQVDSRGQTSYSGFIVPTAVSQRTRAILGNIRQSLMSVPLPEEAIGRGARWEVRRTINVYGVDVTQTMTYSLLELNGTTGRLVVTLRQTAAPHDVPMEDSEMISYIEAYETTGVGSIELDLTHITPYSTMDFGAFNRGFVVRGENREPTESRFWGSIAVYPTARVGAAEEVNDDEGGEEAESAEATEEPASE